MAAVETTWLSPRFDRMNVLSKAIKVSPVFARGDGWRFDDHDEKQYIDPEWTVIPVIWQIFARLFAPPVLLSRGRRFLGRNSSEQRMKRVFIFINTSQVWLGHNLWNIGLHYRTHRSATMRPSWGLKEKKKTRHFQLASWLAADIHTHMFFQGGSHFLKALPI